MNPGLWLKIRDEIRRGLQHLWPGRLWYAETAEEFQHAVDKCKLGDTIIVGYTIEGNLTLDTQGKKRRHWWSSDGVGVRRPL